MNEAVQHKQRIRVPSILGYGTLACGGILTLAAPFVPYISGFNEPYLHGLQDHCVEVLAELEGNAPAVRCDDDSHLILSAEEAEYVFSDYGAWWVETDSALIDVTSRSPHDGKVTAITVMVGGGIDAAKATYRMRDLSTPSVFYWGDNLEWVQSSIEAEISTDEMQQLVAQAEHYQQLVRSALDKRR